jgi:hypothetical protein
MRAPRGANALIFLSLIFSLLSANPAAGAHGSETQSQTTTSEAVSVSHHKEGKLEFVEGRIRINQRPERVWPILSNPFEFEQSISPRFRMTQVLVDRPEVSLIKCSVDTGILFPAISYTVESHYDHGKKITFQSKEGTLKDFRGFWELSSADNGNASYVTYSMYVEPGIPVPQWIVRQGIRMELPHTLEALRNRVDEIYSGRGAPPVRRSISASGEVTAWQPRRAAG